MLYGAALVSFCHPSNSRSKINVFYDRRDREVAHMSMKNSFVAIFFVPLFRFTENLDRCTRLPTFRWVWSSHFILSTVASGKFVAQIRGPSKKTFGDTVRHQEPAGIFSVSRLWSHNEFSYFVLDIFVNIGINWNAVTGRPNNLIMRETKQGNYEVYIFFRWCVIPWKDGDVIFPQYTQKSDWQVVPLILHFWVCMGSETPHSSLAFI